MRSISFLFPKALCFPLSHWSISTTLLKTNKNNTKHTHARTHTRLCGSKISCAQSCAAETLVKPNHKSRGLSIEPFAFFHTPHHTTPSLNVFIPQIFPEHLRGASMIPVTRDAVLMSNSQGKQPNTLQNHMVRALAMEGAKY